MLQLQWHVLASLWLAKTAEEAALLRNLELVAERLA